MTKILNPKQGDPKALSNKIKNSSGLTLTELIISLGLLAILLGIATPRINQWLLRYKLQGAARGVVSHMQLAKRKAVTLNENCGVFFNLGGATYTLFKDNGTTPNQYDANDSQDQPNISLPSGVSFAGCTFANNAAIFRPKGTSNGGTIIIQNPWGSRSITVLFTTGRIRVY